MTAYAYDPDGGTDYVCADCGQLMWHQAGHAFRNLCEGCQQQEDNPDQEMAA